MPFLVFSRGATKWLKRAASHPLFPTTLICGFVFTVVFTLWRIGFFQFFELQISDRIIKSRSRTPAEASKVVIIGITEEDIQSEEAYPIPDDILLKALQQLTSGGPAAIVVDLYRDLPVPGKDPEGTSKLTEFWLAHPNILAIQRLGLNDQPSVRRPRFLKGPEHDHQVGFNDFSVDYTVDDTARRALLIMDDGKESYSSVAFLAAQLYLQPLGIELEQDEVNEQHFRLGKADLWPFEPDDGPYVGADARGLQMQLDFRGPETFPTHSLTDLLTGKINPEELRGNVVLVGLLASSLKDHLITPLAKRYPGVLLHAHVVNQLLRHAIDGHRSTRFWPGWQEMLWLFFWCAAGTLTGLYVRSPLVFVFVILGCLGTLVGVYWLAFDTNLWLPVVAPATAYACAAVLGKTHQAYLEKEQRDVLMQLFSRHVAAGIAADVWRRREEFMEGHIPKAQVINATVFFTDLKGFTAKAEMLPPQELLAWLNEYMEVMSALIEQHGGMVNKYMGDAIMAVFGAPIPRSSEAEIRQDAVHAVRCALAMGQALDQLNRSWAERDLPTTTMRIGIATGPLVSGSIGGTKRLEYTVTGDTVVIAKRLESLEKESTHLEMASLSNRILITEMTHAMVAPHFRTRDAGPMQLEGKRRSVGVYVVIGENGASKS